MSGVRKFIISLFQEILHVLVLDSTNTQNYVKAVSIYTWRSPWQVMPGILIVNKVLIKISLLLNFFWPSTLYWMLPDSADPATFLPVPPRVLARISKMPVQNSNFKISARPDLATNLIQILIAATFNSLVCQKGQFTLQLCPRRWFVRKIFVYYPPKVKIEKSS